MESLATSILNKILHSPIAALKKDADGRSQLELVAMVREIFDIAEPSEPFGGGEKEEEEEEKESGKASRE